MGYKQNDRPSIIKRIAVLTVVGAAVTLMGLIGACGTGSGSARSTHSAATGMDNDAFLACSHFRNVSSDAHKGLLSSSELRTKLQQIYSDASIANRSVRHAATAMVRSATAGNVKALTSAVDRMNVTCAATGN